MSKLFKTLLCVSLLFSSVFVINAQNSSNEPKVETKYDQDKNETQVEVTQIPISVDNSKQALLSVSASFKGQKISKPDDVIFIISIVSVGNNYKYPQINRVTLFSEEKAFGEIVMLNLDQRKYNDNEVLETIGTRMKFEILKKFIAAKKVTFQMGASKFQVNEAEIAKIIEFEKAINL